MRGLKVMLAGLMLDHLSMTFVVRQIRQITYSIELVSDQIMACAGLGTCCVTPGLCDSSSCSLLTYTVTQF